MPYVDLAGLSRFAGKSKDFASSAFAGPDMANWQKTPAAGAVSFSPVPEMPIDPVVNFLFAESGPASGTKGPDNPSTITGVAQAKVTRCGKNVLRSAISTVTKNGITCTNNGDGSYTLNGTASSDTSFNSSNTSLPVGYYKMSGCPAGGSPSTYYLGSGGGYRCYGSSSESSLIDHAGGQRGFWIGVGSGTTVSNLVFKPQFELGSAATAFEPYEGADYTVNLGGTYYGGSVDLSVGTMTVTWAHQTVTGGATNLTTIDASTLQFRFSVTSGNHIASDTTNLACNRFVPGTTLLTTGYASQLYYARIDKSLLDVSGAVDPSNPTDAEWLAAINAWLASNPVEVVYKLATPTTISLTTLQIYSLSQIDPYSPRLNTVYSDQASVQVGYPKSPQASQTELTNAIVSLGSNL